jgi:ABC-type multidrug transport system fused ATPase/permease subunit
MRSFWAKSDLRRIFDILSIRDKYKVLAIALIQMLLSMLDLIGVLIIGLLGTISVSGIQSQKLSPNIVTVLSLIGLDEATFQIQVITLSSIAAILFVGRTLLSIFFTRKILFFLSRRGAQISASLVSRLLSQPILMVQSRSTQETVYAVTQGVESIVLQVLATSVVMISDVSILIVMSSGLFIVDPTSAVGTLVIFALIGYLLYLYMHVRASELGKKSSDLNIISNNKIVEVIGSYRESVVRNRRDYYAREIGKIRTSLADTSAEIGFFPYVSKYVIETAVIIGAIFISFAEFLLYDATKAVGTLAIFLAAGSRIAPAVLRIQQGLITVIGAIGRAKPTLALIEMLEDSPNRADDADDEVHTDHINFNPALDLSAVGFSFHNNRDFELSNIDLKIPSGSLVAIVGPSGAGKTTLVDLILGILTPGSGKITISSLTPDEAIVKWPGAISYVPQDVLITSGTIRENVSLGYPIEFVSDDLVKSAIRLANLQEFVDSLPEGIETEVGERGTKMSGGQRQRLGIARALFTKPKLLVLDEATSALDAESEASITLAIEALRGNTTVIMIAHRLSTVRDADLIVYMEKGRILTTGTFEKVRSQVPDFDLQARLFGL